MFGEAFGLDYYQQRHTELLQEAELGRMIRILEASHRAEQSQNRRVGLHKRVLANAGEQLVRLGNRMQRASALSAQ